MRTATTTDVAAGAPIEALLRSTRPPAAAAALLLLGSNVDAERQLEGALRLLAEQFPVLATSPIHPSPALGAVRAPAYLNQAVCIASKLTREELKASLRQIEARLGRQRPAPDPSRCPIDIDALFAWNADGLTLWDRKALHAPYAQAPLRELLAGWT